MGRSQPQPILSPNPMVLSPTAFHAPLDFRPMTGSGLQMGCGPASSTRELVPVAWAFRFLGGSFGWVMIDCMLSGFGSERLCQQPLEKERSATSNLLI